MSTRTFALIFGIVFTLAGLAGFIPALLQPFGPEDPDLAVRTLSGRLLALFPVNVLHSLVHLAFGIWGLIAYRSWSGARTYAKGVAIIYAVLLVAGFIPGLNTMFGLVPLYGHDIWLHVVLAAPAAYFGFRREDEPGRTAAARV